LHTSYMTVFNEFFPSSLNPSFRHGSNVRMRLIKHILNFQLKKQIATFYWNLNDVCFLNSRRNAR